MTDTDRAYISGKGDATGNQRMQSVSRVRSRITKELLTDIEVLEEHRPDPLDDLRNVVCSDDDDVADSGVERSLDLVVAKRSLDDLEHALECGDQAAVEQALERARDAIDGGGGDE